MMEQYSFIKKLILYLGIITVFSGIFLLVYAPVIQKDFFYEDDYLYLKEVRGATVLMNEDIKEGRVLNGLIGYYLLRHIVASQSVITVRLIGIVSLALFAAVMWAILKRFKVKSDHAFLMSVLICTLPATQIYILWACIFHFIWGALLSSLSALISFNVLFDKESKGKTDEMVRFLTAIILFVVSLTIYQSAAMMYWTVGVIFLLTSEETAFLKVYRRQLITYFIIGLISISVYYVIFIQIVPFVLSIPNERAALIAIHKIPVKFIKFLIIPLKNALNLWNVYPTYIVAFFVSMIIFSEVITGYLRSVKDKKQFLAKNYGQKYFLILCLLMLSYLPSLMVSENAYTYRTLISLGTALSILFCFGLINVVEFLKVTHRFSAESRKTVTTILLAVLVIVTAAMARYNATHWQSPNQLDIYLWEKWGIG